jgi:hypothetical protein
VVTDFIFQPQQLSRENEVVNDGQNSAIASR